VDEHLARLFEAHVRYELDRWRPGAVGDTVAEEVGAWFDGPGTGALRAVVPPERAQAWLREVAAREPADGVLEEVQWAVRAAHESLAQETGPLTDEVSRERYDGWVAAAVGLRRVRTEAVDQLTLSRVYADLIAHVLYHGLKNYALTENAVVRRIPGASSLVRMGQSAVRSATPRLEAEIDRRLLAFVADTVADTVGDSRAFLEEMLDDAMLGTVAEELRATNGPRAVGELADLVEEESLGAVVAAAWDTWLDVRASPLVGRVIDTVVEQFYAAHGDEPVADVVAALGLTRGAVAAALTAAAGPVVGAAVAGGHLETYVRRRLEGFYGGPGAALGADPAATPGADPGRDAGGGDSGRGDPGGAVTPSPATGAGGRRSPRRPPPR